MSEQTENTNNVLVGAHLTEEQVQSAILEYLLKHDEFKEIVTGKPIIVTTDWHTTKWSNPDVLVHLVVRENTDYVHPEREETVSPESSEETAAEATEEESEETATEPTRFFKETE